MKKLYLLSLLMAFFLALPANALVDDTLCSSSDTGGTTCNSTQLKANATEEINALSKRDTIYLNSVSGTNTITATAASATTKTITSYTNGQPFYLKPAVTNTNTVTLNVDTVGPIAVVSSAGSALGSGDLQSTSIYNLVYYSAGPQFRVVSVIGTGTASASNPFVTMALAGGLSAERVLTAGTGLGLADSGANGLATFSITDAELACILAQTSAADKISYWTGSGTCALADFPSAHRTYLTTSSIANLAAVLTDEAAGWATLQTTPSMANLGAFLSDDASGWTTFGTTPSMANLGSLLSDDASGWTTFGTTPTSANARALYTDEIGTGVLFFLGAPASDDQVFISTSTSAGAWGTLPDSDAATQKLQYDQTANAFIAGTDDDIPDAGDFTNLALSGDVVSSALVTTIQPNSVALGTDTTNNYALGDAEGGAATTGDSATAFFSAGTIEDARIDGSLEADEVNPTLGTQTQGNFQTGNTAGAGIAVTQTPAEGFSATIALDYADQGASPVLGADACQFTSNATTSGFIVCEGDTADAFESRTHFVDPTADRLLTIPNADSNSVQPLACGGTDKVSAISALGVVTCTADAGGAGSGDNISVNGAAATDADFDDATPAAPAGGINVKVQKDAGTPNNISSYVPFGAGLSTAGGNLIPTIKTSTKTSAYTVVEADRGSVIKVQTNSVTLTLTAAATLGDGFWFISDNDNAIGTNTLIIDPNAAETIDGVATSTDYSGAKRLVKSNGTSWISDLITGGAARFTVTGSNNFIVPNETFQYRVVSIGAGGGGGGGQSGASGSIRLSGSGGGGGAYCFTDLIASDLGTFGATITATVGAGGTAGTGSSGASGTDGGVGGNSTFGTLNSAYGGGGGKGGVAAAAGAGGSGGGCGNAGVAGSVAAGSRFGGDSNVATTMGAGTSGSSAANATVNPSQYGGAHGGGIATAAATAGLGATSVKGGGGGGSGAGIVAANTSEAGGAGGDTRIWDNNGGGGGAGGTTGGTAGTAGAAGNSAKSGQGGGGGGTNGTSTCGAGGVGGAAGGGGGGGAACLTGTAGGAGGVGGRGEIIVWYW